MDIIEIQMITLVVKNRHNEILLLQRSSKNKHYKLHWQFPEGKIEPGERPRNAAKREFQEEIGFLPVQLNHIDSLKIEVKKNGMKYKILKEIFETPYQKIDIKLSEDHIKYRYLAKEKALKTLNLVPGTKEVLKII